MNETKQETTHTPGPWWLDGPTHVVAAPVDDQFGNRSVAVTATRYDGPTNAANARLIAAAPDLLAALRILNHMGGDERGGYCICPRSDGSAPNEKHSTGCAMARAAISKAEGK